MTKILKRSLAMVLALLIVLSGANLSAMNALAAGDTQSVSVAKLMATNYALSDAEKALLNSGLLTSNVIKYAVPDENDGLVTVDTDGLIITAESYTDSEGNVWKPTTAIITYNGNEKVVEISSGEYNYSANATEFGKAFSVKVHYVMSADVDVAEQEELLAVGGHLKQGVANIDAVAEQSGNLYILEQALPTLYDIAINGIYAFGQYIQMDAKYADAKEAIISMYNESVANGGQLLISTMIAEYDNASATEYLVNKGVAMQAAAEDMAAKTSVLNTWLNETKALIGYADETTQKQLSTLYGVVDKIVAALIDVNADDWYAANNYTNDDVVVGDVLDVLVANFGNSTTVTPVENLVVGETNIQVNMAMYNVTINVILETVDANNEVTENTSASVTITLTEGATAEEILAAVEETGIDAPENWDAYDAEHYVRETSELPEALTEDLTHTITYSPDSYTVTIAGESAEYPYGYQLTLPEHEDPAQAYDYYILDTYVAQGTVITVEGDMEITREIGAAYTEGNLFAIIADNAGNEKLTAILKSGALNGNEAVNYRVPTDLSALVTLSGSTLTAQTYAASYKGLLWVPYNYVVDGTEYFFNGATEVTIDGEFDSVSVNYRLTLENYSVDKVTGIVDLAINLVDEANGQVAILNTLASYSGDMSSLNKNMFSGLKGIIGDQDIDEETKALFIRVINGIITECFDSNGTLNIYNIITAYKDPQNGGLAYYYENSEYVLDELNKIVGYLNEMLLDENGNIDEYRLDILAGLMSDLGYGSYVDKLTDIQGKLEYVQQSLVAPNAAINTNSANLDVLTKALLMSGDIGGFTAVVPYLQLGPVTLASEKNVVVTVTVTNNGVKETTSVTVKKGMSLGEDQYKELRNWAYDRTDALDADLYESNYNGGQAIQECAVTALEDNVTIDYVVTAKEFTVKIDGEADQTISVNTTWKITLPGHPNASAGMSYAYTVDGTECPAGSYTFTVDQIKTLFVDGTYTITRVEKNEATEKLIRMVKAMNDEIGYEAVTLVEENGVYTGIVANIGMDDLMNFVMSLVNSGYSYIGLNNEGLMYLNDENVLEVSIQTLVNAILNDSEFGTESLVALGANGNGKLVSASLQLGNSATEIQYEGLNFVINLTSVPSQMKTVAEYLDLVSPYVNFKSNNGILDVTLNLPDQVYGAYLMALVATGEVDMTDINAVNQAIAFEFLYDYLEIVLNSEMDLETYTNTLTMFGLDYDLTGYNHIYDKAINIYKDATTVTFAEDSMGIDLSFEGKKVIGGLLKLLGTSVNESLLGMIKEYKEGEVIEASADAALTNVDKTYNAMIVDAQASGVKNKFACTSSDSALANKTKSLAGYSVIILLDDVGTDLTISGTTILDLNGHNVDGVITGTGNLYIIDSTRDTYAAGTVEDVSGNVVVIAGNYNNDVSAFLKDGYYMDGTTVRNNMYYVSSASTYAAGASKNAYYVLNTNLISGGIPAYKAIAIDIAADMLLNYWTAAALNIEGNDVYKVDFEDVIGLLTSGSKVDALIEEGIDTIDVPGISNIINIILDDLVDFDAIAEAIENGAPIADYDVTISPWAVDIVHVTENGQNYASIALTNNSDKASTYTVALVVDGEYADELGAIADELSKIVEDETDISVSFTQPKFDAENNTIVFTDNSATAVVSVDMSVNSDYATMIGVIVAYGNPAKRAAIANAINSGNEIALKAVIDNTTVAEVFTALKAMSRNVSFTSMAATVGVTVDVSSAAELEAVYHVVLCAAGKGLEEADITGKNSKLGNLYNEETGYYELSKEDIYRDVEISKKGYTAIIDMEATELTLKVKIFGEDCMWGDADHDNKVTPYDASLILQYCVGNEFDDYFCTERTDVNGDGSITPYDASIVLQYTVGTVTELPHQD